MSCRYQNRYWNLLKEVKTHSIYVQFYALNSERWENGINIILAIAASSSIAAWAIWDKFQLVWAIIIASSQIINVIKPFLPYKKRLKVLNELTSKLAEISLELEKDWFSVSEGELNEKEIYNLSIEFHNKSMKETDRILKNLSLPHNSRILKNAEIEADKYFTAYYTNIGE